MWGDDFASALTDWLYAADERLLGRAVQGLTLYGDLLNTLCDTATPSVETRLHRENYPELARLTRGWEVGVAPISRLTGAPRDALMQPLVHLLSEVADESQQIAILRCLRRLFSQAQPLDSVVVPITNIAANTDSRTLEREAVIALCHLDCDRAAAYMGQYWREDEQRRQMAAEILGLARTEAAFDMLRELTTEPNAETRRKAISSMESFDSGAALDVLNALQESDPKTQRQLLRSRSQLKRRIQRKAFKARKAQGAIYTISPLVLLSQAPAKPAFSERALTASMDPGLISDISSSRRYAVEMGLLERRTDLYRLSGMGAAIHWVEVYVQDGLRRFA